VSATLELSRKGHASWKRTVATPQQTFVSDDGYVVTLDTTGQAGSDHALVIYDAANHVIVDRRLEELLATAEIKNITSSGRGGGRVWIGTAALGKDRLDVTLYDGKTKIAFRLKDGVELRKEKPFSIPTDDERFKAYVTGKRAFDSVSVDVMWSVGAKMKMCVDDEKTTDCSGSIDDTDGTRRIVQHTKQALRKQIAAAAFLTGVEHGTPTAAAGDRWQILVDFKESGVDYGYRWTFMSKPDEKVLGLMDAFAK
jgi:hypothetical protein